MGCRAIVLALAMPLSLSCADSGDEVGRTEAELGAVPTVGPHDDLLTYFATLAPTHMTSAATASAPPPPTLSATPNYGIAATPPPDALQAARDALLQSRSDRLDGCAARIYASFDRLPWPQNQQRADALFERIIGADEVYAITSVGAMPSEADEAARLARLLREASVR